MNHRKVFLISLLSNVLFLSALMGVFVFAQTAQARAPASAPAAPALSGPFFYTMTSFDFVPLDNCCYAFNRGGFGIYRASATPDYAIAPVHLPSGAQISELLIDAYDVTGSGSVSVILQSCDVGRDGCDTQGAAVTSLDGGRKTATQALAYVVNNTNTALIVVAKFDGSYGSPGDVSLDLVRLAYYLPATTFLPSIQR